MMKTRYILLLSVLVFILSSCDHDAHITVTNEVSNVRIEKISYGDISLNNQALLPGETSAKKTIVDKWDNVKFPMHERLQFYMVSGTNKVFLMTKETYKLDEDQTLNIIINNDTEVVNPASSEKSSIVKICEIK